MNCKECKKEAVIENGEVKKTCQCECGVEADMKATAKGNGSLK